MPNESGNELSIQALADEMGKTPQALFQQLSEMGLIVNGSNGWELTAAGKSKGGVTKGDKYANYPAFPESIKAELERPKIAVAPILLTSTAIGKHFDKHVQRINSILSEIGWIKKELDGWKATELGKRLGAVQSRVESSGEYYVRWPESIIRNNILIGIINEAKGDSSITTPNKVETSNTENVEFRDKFEAKLRATDGHYVRSKAELLIDNWLYVSQLVHAYERKLPIEEDVYCDFYIPTEKVYIEYWGIDNDPKYSARKEIKKEIYKKYSFKLINLTDKEVNNLDDTLPKLLLGFGIKTD